MSLVLVAVGPGGVLVCADSVSYDIGSGEIGWTNKVHPLPHLEALLTGVGDSTLTHRAAEGLLTLNGEQLAIDDVADRLPSALQTAWTSLGKDDEDHDFCTLYLAGWSPSRQTHVVHRYASEDGFERTERTEGVGCWPAPIDTTGLGTPSDEAGWVALAEHIRAEQIALPPGQRTLIGGRLVLTWLGRHELSQRTIHVFDDSPELWARYLEDCHTTDGGTFTPPQPVTDTGWHEMRPDAP